MYKSSFYKVCPDCKSTLDPGEMCDCLGKPDFYSLSSNLNVRQTEMNRGNDEKTQS